MRRNSVLFVLVTLSFLTSLVYALPAGGSGFRRGRVLDRYPCNPKLSKNYKVPDPAQCDRYAVCRDGNKSIELCPDGFGYNKKSGECLLLAHVDCAGRPRLQETTSTNPDCPRANGDFEIRGHCSKYYNCEEGQSFLRDCPAGAVFARVPAICVHPQQASRTDCRLPLDKLGNFTCPNFEKDDRELLKFGDHYRLPFPGGDCSKYVVCPTSREPKVQSCQKPKVFDPESGFCKTSVKGCEGFYKSEEEEGKDLALAVDPFGNGGGSNSAEEGEDQEE